jgi:hypothetical protein
MADHHAKLRVHAPMDEQSQTQIAEPGHAFGPVARVRSGFDVIGVHLPSGLDGWCGHNLLLVCSKTPNGSRKGAKNAKKTLCGFAALREILARCAGI